MVPEGAPAVHCAKLTLSGAHLRVCCPALRCVAWSGGRIHSWRTTNAQTKVDDAVREVVGIHNARLRIQRLRAEIEELAKHGPSKPMEEQGIDEEVSGLSLTEEKKERGPTYCADPLGKRTGEAPEKELAKVLLDAAGEADKAASSSKVEARQCLTLAALEEAIQTVSGAVMICYPMGLPPWDPVKDMLEGTEQLAGSSAAKDVFDPDTAQMFFASKAMVRSNPLSSHVGKNEKTKVVVKLVKKGGQAPAKEQAVDAETQKAMMAFYHKKRQEHEALAANQDDDYTHSSWASGNSLKAAFAGVDSGIKFR